MIHRAKHLLLDVVGIVLIIGSPLLGWLPGPGGIPMFLAGLSLLAVNHTWARKWLKIIKQKGLNVLDIIFVDHPVWKASYDIISLLLVIGGVYLITTYTRNLTLSIAIILVFTGIGLFVTNRKRLQRFTNWIKQR